MHEPQPTLFGALMRTQRDMLALKPPNIHLRYRKGHVCAQYHQGRLVSIKRQLPPISHALSRPSAALGMLSLSAGT